MEKIKGVIDPGHGGNDRYNVGPTGYIEADGVLEISKYIEEFLEATGYFAIDLTRTEDKTVSLTDRGLYAAKVGAKFFLSEHTNANDGMATGCETYCSVDIPQDMLYAQKLSDAVARAIGIPSRGAKVRESQKYPGEDYYTVIDTAQDNGVPHVFLIESAYHDNPKDEAILKDTRSKMKIAIAQGLVLCEMFSLDLKIDSEILKIVQRELNKHAAYGLAEDGIYGPQTGSAIMHFQKSNNWPMNGLLDENIMSKVYRAPEPKVEQKPDEPVTKEPEPKLPFFDIKGHYAEEYILQASGLGLVKGFPDGSFKPDQSITRAQAVVMILNLYRLIEGTK